MSQNPSWEEWNRVPRLGMTIAEVGYNRYQVRLQAGPEGKSIARLTTLSADLRDQIAFSFKKPYREPDLETYRQIGHQMYATFFPGALNETLNETVAAYEREQAASSGGPLPVRLRLEIQDPLLHYLPWEYLSDPEGTIGSPAAPLAAVRYTPRAVSIDPLPFNWPLKILVVVASPAIKIDIDPYAEMSVLGSSLEAARSEGHVMLEMLENPTRDDLARALSEKRPHVLHYIGHGFVSRGSGYLALRQATGPFSDFVSAADLGAMIPAGSLRLIGLQTPEARANYQLGAFAGFAANIAAARVAGICFSLLPHSAQALGRLYVQLAAGQAVDRAIHENRSEAAPVLLGFHQHGPTSQILTDPHQEQVRLTLSPKEIDVVQSTIEQAAQQAPSSRSATAIRKQGDKLIVQMSNSVKQLVLTPGQLAALDRIWQGLESLTEEATGQAIRSYASVGDWEWDEIRSGSRPPSETHFALLAQQYADEFAFVQDSLSRLREVEQRYQDEPPDWLQAEVASYEARLTDLVAGVKGG
jgi:hypothetical protein